MRISTLACMLCLGLVIQTAHAQEATEKISQEKPNEASGEIAADLQKMTNQLALLSRTLGEKDPKVSLLKAKIMWTSNYYREVYNSELRGGWVDLFNGENLDGWVKRGGDATFQFSNGILTGMSATEESPNTFLCTEREYANFEMSFQIKLDNELNSGVQIRSRTNDAPGTEKGSGQVYGPQVELMATGTKGGDSGFLLAEGLGQRWISVRKNRKPHNRFKDGKWNSVYIFADGTGMKSWINGVQTENHEDREIYRTNPSGFVAFEIRKLKPGQTGPFKFQIRNAKLREIKRPDQSRRIIKEMPVPPKKK